MNRLPQNTQNFTHETSRKKMRGRANDLHVVVWLVLVWEVNLDLAVLVKDDISSTAYIFSFCSLVATVWI